MTNQQIKAKKVETKTALEKLKQDMIAKIQECDDITDKSKTVVANYIRTTKFRRMHLHDFWQKVKRKDGKFDIDWVNELVEDDISEGTHMENFLSNAKRYVDSKAVKFNGDIVLCDPGSIMNPANDIPMERPNWIDYITRAIVTVKVGPDGKEHKYYDWPKDRDYPDARKKTLADVCDDPVSISQFKLECAFGTPMFSPTLAAETKAYYDADHAYFNNPKCDWERCDMGYAMDKLGFKTWLTRDTLYGDAAFSVVDVDSDEEIGEFYVEGGSFAVVALDELRNYYPELVDGIEENDEVVLVKDFKGTIQYVVEENANNKWQPYRAKLVLSGINQTTGDKVNFETRQSSY